MMAERWTYLTPGIPDALFLRGDVPLTKEEVRAVVLAKARLAPGQIIYDVGAGTGSLAVEAARLVPGGRVYAVEKNPAALDLITANASRFGTGNLITVAGEAPEALAGLPPADRMIVGGSGGRLAEILAAARGVLTPAGRLVLTAVTVDTLVGALSVLDGLCADPEITCLNVARAERAGSSRLWRGQNPVYIIATDLGG